MEFVESNLIINIKKKNLIPIYDHSTKSSLTLRNCTVSGYLLLPKFHISAGFSRPPNQNSPSFLECCLETSGSINVPKTQKTQFLVVTCTSKRTPIKPKTRKLQKEFVEEERRDLEIGVESGASNTGDWRRC